jgi:hypothetical protein
MSPGDGAGILDASNVCRSSILAVVSPFSSVTAPVDAVTGESTTPAAAPAVALGLLTTPIPTLFASELEPEVAESAKADPEATIPATNNTTSILFICVTLFLVCRTGERNVPSPGNRYWLSFLSMSPDKRPAVAPVCISPEEVAKTPPDPNALVTTDESVLDET